MPLFQSTRAENTVKGLDLKKEICINKMGSFTIHLLLSFPNIMAQKLETDSVIIINHFALIRGSWVIRASVTWWETQIQSVASSLS